MAKPVSNMRDAVSDFELKHGDRYEGAIKVPSEYYGRRRPTNSSHKVNQ